MWSLAELRRGWREEIAKVDAMITHLKKGNKVHSGTESDERATALWSAEIHRRRLNAFASVPRVTARCRWSAAIADAGGLHRHPGLAAERRAVKDKAAVLADVCAALSVNQADEAGMILREGIHSSLWQKSNVAIRCGGCSRRSLAMALSIGIQACGWSAWPRYG
jgi:hypothetical protein